MITRFLGKIKHNAFVVSSSIYVVSNIVNASIPFMLLPVLTRVLSPAEYGVFLIYILLVNGLVPFTGLQISRSIVRNYIDQDKIDISLYVSSCLLLSTISTLLIFGIITIFSGTLSELFSFPKSWLWAPIIASFGQTYLAVSLGLLQMNNKPISYGLTRIGHSLLLAALTVYFVLYLDWNWEGAVFGHVLAMTFFIPAALYVLSLTKYIKLNVSYDYALQAIKYGAPLIPHVIGTVVITMIDRIFISHFIGMEALGIYGSGYQISLILFLLITSFNQAFTPWLFPRIKAGKEKTKLKIVKVTYAYFVILMVFAILLSLISAPFVRIYLDESYFAATEVIPWLLCSFVLHGMYIMFGNFLYYSKSTGILSIATLIAAISNIFLNWILIPLNGIIGAAQASIFAFFFAFIFTWYFSTKKVKMPWFSIYKRV